MNKFILSEEEKKKILNQHISRGYKTTINENTEPKTKIKTGEELNDAELKERACMTWNRWKSISKDDAIMKAKEWTKTVTGNKYPYDMDVVCKSTTPTSGIGSDADRMVLKGVIELAWVGQNSTGYTKPINRSHMGYSALKGLREEGELNEGQESHIANMSIQCFLNKKGIKDDSGQPLEMDGLIGDWPKSKSAQAIARYQVKLIMIPADGKWTINLINKMPANDKIMFIECISEQGGEPKKILQFLGAELNDNIIDEQGGAIGNAARSAAIQGGLAKQGNSVPQQLIDWLKKNNVKNGQWSKDLKNPQKIVVSYLPPSTLGSSRLVPLVSIYKPSTVSADNGKWEFNGTTVIFK